MNRLFGFLNAAIILAGFMTLASCENESDLKLQPEENSFAQGKLIIYLSDDSQTKTTYDYSGGRLKTSWANGDAVFVAPGGVAAKGGLYKIVSDADASTSTFTQQTDFTLTSLPVLFYYPGNKVTNDPDFMNFSYTGQVQKKSDPMGHLAAYHTMRQEIDEAISNPNSISFEGCEQSGCIRFVLSGRTFVNPARISLSVVDKEGKTVTDVLYSTNCLGYYYPNDYDTYPSNSGTNASELSLGLEGYESETKITAYMMLSNYDMVVQAGDSLRVTVYENGGKDAWYSNTACDEATTIKGGYCSTLTANDGWKQLPGDYTEYSYDGEVVTLQEAGTGLDLVIMGDGFINEDFVDGTYESIMKQAYTEFFSVKPLSDLKDDFNVYYVKAVSPERINAISNERNGAKNTGTHTKFSTTFTDGSTSVSGDNDLVREYAKKAFKTNASTRIMDATIIVMANQECRAGTCHNSYYTDSSQDYGRACAVAYCALGRNADERVELIHHEVDGHGFGKLADEYSYTGYNYTQYSGISDQMTSLGTRHDIGLFRNVDSYITDDFNTYYGTSLENTKDSAVLWYDLIGTSNGYESEAVESLGVYAGAYVFEFGFCRPTEDAFQSIMNYNTGIFNAISRRQIYYRYRHLKGELTSSQKIWGTSDELQAFLDWDADVNIPSITSSKTTTSVSPTRRKCMVEENLLPFAPPVMEEGTWVNGRFIKNK